MKKSVYLIGHRAVGKSCVGETLARKLGYNFLDTDTLITDKCGCTVAEIVENEGWPAFRDYEKQVLFQLIHQESSVVATGGGAILHRNLWADIKKQSIVIWLKADVDILCKRIAGDQFSARQRPSLTGKDVFLELEDVLKERNPLYNKTADDVVDSGKMTIDESVASIEQIYAAMNKE